MTVRKTIPLGVVWEEAMAFCKAEAALLTPLALLGFALPAVVLSLLMPDKLVIGSQPQLGAWMLWIVPYALFSMLGTLSISALTSRPGISVSEALQIGLRRVPTGIAVALMALGLVVVALVPVIVVGVVEMSVHGKPGPFTLIAYLAALVGLIWVSLRLLPVWATIATGQVGSAETVRATLAATRERAPLMLVLRLIAWISEALVWMAITMPVGAVLRVVGRVTGAGRVTDFILLLVSACIGAALGAVWTVFVAMLQRRLAGFSSGT
ncbi:hypothetical protein HZF05_17460 [Sphingomonas sp. CGMCC 1.13654]|uniref:Glycerophosphoryl diester phosphodiesterase membrane domain-containing protein n=1 Tax=Sphingomonas chungangi TaxID=2683589 RepID=A0A838L9A7_9SPHN|nr:hypothetical protein [Sphingomonas chungangi]MBA2935871.1 hypothetical protein [Sphingomonas chungangi]MVW54562.1 hypothetical protein [Sphingomonas chungangi]